MLGIAGNPPDYGGASPCIDHPRSDEYPTALFEAGDQGEGEPVRPVPIGIPWYCIASTIGHSAGIYIHIQGRVDRRDRHESIHIRVMNANRLKRGKRGGGLRPTDSQHDHLILDTCARGLG